MELKDWLNSINFNKEDLSENISSYPPYIINRCLSGHLDCVMFANEMNRYNFLDKDSDSGFDTVEPASTEYHWLEAENADSVVNPFQVVDDENASEGKYVYSANGTGNQYTPGPIMLTYTVNISHAGEYIMWGRVKASDDKDNSFFIIFH